MPSKKSRACDHDLIKEYYLGSDTGDLVCRKCRETFTPSEAKAFGNKDVNVNAHRVFGEIIERSEQPPNRGNLKPVPSKKRR